jgi:hypothetical protein
MQVAFLLSIFSHNLKVQNLLGVYFMKYQKKVDFL